MIQHLLKYWYLPLLRGLVFLAAGLYMIFNPLESALGFTTLVGYLAIVAGVLYLVELIGHWTEMHHKGWIIARGVLDIFFGLMVLQAVVSSLVIFTIIFGFWAIMSGAIAVMAALEFKRKGHEQWWLGLLLAALIIIAGIYISLNPMISSLTLMVFFGIQMLVLALFEITLSLRIRNIQSKWKDLKESE